MKNKMANTIRFLCADMVQAANSGHPGAPMGMSEIMVVLSKFLRHNPKNPKWLNRDRLVLSGGHASSLLYAFLHLSGYDISLDDLKNFRQLNSKTPGHPEIETPGVEINTGPLGQGVANAVGFAMAAKTAENLLGSEIINHKIYCLCGDGDLQEGISYEACSLAGRHQLDNLILIYDSNNITIEGDTNIAFDEDIKSRFEAQGWEVARVNGHDFDELEFAFSEAQNKNRPFLIIAQTTIAKGAGKLEGSHHAHGAPLGSDIIAAAKSAAGFDPKAKFSISDDVRFAFSSAVELGDLSEAQWNETLKSASSEVKSLLNELLNPDFSKIKWPDFSGAKMATRDSNHKILNAIADALPGFLGGSADLAPSNKTELIDKGDFPAGKNLHFGIREQAMAAICNSYARYGLFIAFSATFFVFSDYLKAGARIAALMGAKHYFIWTHDSIGVGEDGPTHQPIEHLSSFRAMPNFFVFRPASASENVECWKIAINKNAPAAFVLSRQALSPSPSPLYGDVSRGAYLVREDENAKITFIASGSEVELCLNAAQILSGDGVGANVISAPCFELLNKQDEGYLNRLFKNSSKIVAVEAASAFEWYKYADLVISMQSFGASAPASELFDKYGFSAICVATAAKSLL